MHRMISLSVVYPRVKVKKGAYYLSLHYGTEYCDGQDDFSEQKKMLTLCVCAFEKLKIQTFPLSLHSRLSVSAHGIFIILYNYRDRTSVYTLVISIKPSYILFGD